MTANQNKLDPQSIAQNAMQYYNNQNEEKEVIDPLDPYQNTNLKAAQADNIADEDKLYQILNSRYPSNGSITENNTVNPVANLNITQNNTTQTTPFEPIVDNQTIDESVNIPIIQSENLTKENVYESVTYPETNFQQYKSIATSEDMQNTANLNQNNQNYNPTNVSAATKIPTQIVNDKIVNKSRRFWIIAISLILLSLIALFGLYALYNQKFNPIKPISTTTSSSIDNNQSQSNSSVRSINITFNNISGPKPSDVAKKSNDEKLTSLFLNQNFSVSVADGVCKDINICGEMADRDNDGLRNIDEQNFATNPNQNDSDTDQIADGDEVNIFSIDPTKKDSANSGVEDFVRLSVCNDPAFKFTNQSNTITDTRKNEIKNKTNTFKLHEPTITAMNNVGATPDDINNGYIAISCSSVNIKI